jgi:hypothetical protein
MAATKNFQRQMWVVQNLATPPGWREGSVVTEYAVEEWAGNHVNVTREYTVGPHAPTLRMRESFVIGPRGGMRTIYSHLNI